MKRKSILIIFASVLFAFIVSGMLLFYIFAPVAVDNEEAAMDIALNTLVAMGYDYDEIETHYVFTIEERWRRWIVRVRFAPVEGYFILGWTPTFYIRKRDGAIRLSNGCLRTILRYAKKEEPIFSEY